MSAAVVLGLVVAGLMLLFLGAVAVSWRRDTERLRLIRAVRCAKEAELPLPQALVDPLAARLRARTLRQLGPAAVLGAPLLGVATWVNFWEPLDGSRWTVLQGPALTVLVLIPTVLLGAVGELREAARDRRSGADLVPPPQRFPLRAVVPAWLLWTSRALACAIPVLAALVLWLFQRQGVALGFLPYVLGAQLLVVVVALRSVENRQLALLHAGRPAGPAGWSAFDDWFRTGGVVAAVPLVPLLSFLASSLVLQSALSSATAAQRLAALDVSDTFWTPIGLLVFLGSTLLGVSPIRRHYRRSENPPPPAPETAPC